MILGFWIHDICDEYMMFVGNVTWSAEEESSVLLQFQCFKNVEKSVSLHTITV